MKKKSYYVTVREVVIATYRVDAHSEEDAKEFVRHYGYNREEDAMESREVLRVEERDAGLEEEEFNLW